MNIGFHTSRYCPSSGSESNGCGPSDSDSDSGTLNTPRRRHHAQDDCKDEGENDVARSNLRGRHCYRGEGMQTVPQALMSRDTRPLTAGGRSSSDATGRCHKSSKAAVRLFRLRLRSPRMTTLAARGGGIPHSGNMKAGGGAGMGTIELQLPLEAAADMIACCICKRHIVGSESNK